jgi:hypothetical protein
MLQLDMFAEREIDSLLHARSDDGSSKLFVIAVTKLMPGKMAVDLVGQSHEESWNVVPKKVYELIISDDDEDIRPGFVEIGTQSSERGFGVTSESFLLL